MKLNKKKTVKSKTISIDAQDKVLGRLATQVAHLLRGKDTVAFAPNVFPDRKIVITNLAKIRFSGQKASQKMYWRHSGFTGNIKGEVLEKAFLRNPKKVFLNAVSHMLPANRLRAQIIKNLSFTDITTPAKSGN